MRILRLNLTDWRNYRTAEITFEPGANVLAGSNGQGKTNLVEAIGYLTRCPPTASRATPRSSARARTAR